MPRSNLPTQRMFFALWPDDEVRKELASVAKQITQHHQGRVIRTNNIHLTLAFLGNINEAQHKCVEDIANSININSFDLCLDHLGIFARPKVLWMGLEEKPDALMQLSSGLTKCVKACDIQLDDKPYNPHVTLMRKVNQLHDIELKPIHWKVNNFCLVRSVPHPEGVEYKVIKSW